MCELDGLLQTFAENVTSIEPLEIYLENWCSIFILATLYAHTHWLEDIYQQTLVNQRYHLYIVQYENHIAG